MIGATLQNRYRIDAELGHGGMGEVYRATDTQTGDTVAVKTLDPQVVARDSAMLEHFAHSGALGGLPGGARRMNSTSGTAN